MSKPTNLTLPALLMSQASSMPIVDDSFGVKIPEIAAAAGDTDAFADSRVVPAYWSDDTIVMPDTPTMRSMNPRSRSVVLQNLRHSGAAVPSLAVEQLTETTAASCRPCDCRWRRSSRCCRSDPSRRSPSELRRTWPPPGVRCAVVERREDHSVHVLARKPPRPAPVACGRLAERPFQMMLIESPPHSSPASPAQHRRADRASIRASSLE